MLVGGAVVLLLCGGDWSVWCRVAGASTRSASLPGKVAKIPKMRARFWKKAPAEDGSSGVRRWVFASLTYYYAFYVNNVGQTHKDRPSADLARLLASKQIRRSFVCNYCVLRLFWCSPLRHFIVDSSGCFSKRFTYCFVKPIKISHCLSSLKN